MQVEHLCHYCLFKYPACIGAPAWEFSINKDGGIEKRVIHCNAFIETKESEEEIDERQA